MKMRRVLAIGAACALAVAAEAAVAVVAIAAGTTVAVTARTALTALLVGLAGVQRARGGAQRLGENLAFVDPNLDADAAVGGGSLGEAVLDVGADGLQGDGALVIVLNARDFTAAETARRAALDALGAGAHGAAHGVLHGAAVGNTLLDLLSDVLSDELSVHVGVAHLDDVELDVLADELGDLAAELLDLGAVLADDHARTGAVHEQSDDVVGTLDLDLRNAGAVERLLDELADLVVLDDQIADLFISGIPAGVPVFDDADAHAMGVYFLTHKLSPPSYSFSATAIVT